MNGMCAVSRLVNCLRWRAASVLPRPSLQVSLFCLWLCLYLHASCVALCDLVAVSVTRTLRECSSRYCRQPPPSAVSRHSAADARHPGLGTFQNSQFAIRNRQLTPRNSSSLCSKFRDWVSLFLLFHSKQCTIYPFYSSYILYILLAL